MSSRSRSGKPTPPTGVPHLEVTAGDGTDTSERPTSDEAILDATGKTWDEWLAVLDRAGAAARPHREIVALLGGKHGMTPWWRQMVAVGYERARGLREKAQTNAGHTVSVSKTLNVGVSAVYKAWTDPPTRSKWLPGVTYLLRTAVPMKSLRMTWDDETSVQVTFSAQGSAKTQLTVEHARLAGAGEVEKRREFWKERLEEMKGLVEK